MECMIVLLLLMIFSLFLLPGWKSFRISQERQFWKKQFMLTLNQAKTSAVLYQRAVGICGSNDGVHCLSEFQNGILIFFPIFDGENQTFSQDKIEWIKKPKKDKEKIFYRAFPWYRSFIQFDANGLLQADNASFWNCKPKSTHPIWGLAMSKSGQVRKLNENELKKLNCKK